MATVNPDRQFTSAITVGEMIYGALRSNRAEGLMMRLETEIWPDLKILAFDKGAAQIYGSLKSDLEKRGTPLAEPDLRIASIALHHGLTLVTGNVKHFERINGLAVENWLE